MGISTFASQDRERVGKSRFYIDIPSFARSTGYIEKFPSTINSVLKYGDGLLHADQLYLSVPELFFLDPYHIKAINTPQLNLWKARAFNSLTNVEFDGESTDEINNYSSEGYADNQLYNFYGDTSANYQNFTMAFKGNDILSHVNYCGVLGHNLNGSPNNDPWVKGMFDMGIARSVVHYSGGSTTTEEKHSFFSNSDFEHNGNSYDYNTHNNMLPKSAGFNLFRWKTDSDLLNDLTLSDQNRYHFYFDLYSEASNQIINSLTFGWTYTMPHSADLKYNMTIEQGFKHSETKGGHLLTDHFYDAPRWPINIQAKTLSEQPKAWTIQDQEKVAAVFGGAPGRRIWDLQFSFIDESNFFDLNRNDNLFTGSLDNSDHWLWDGLAEDTFISKVLWPIQCGVNKFIFQPDIDNDNFAICYLDQKSFKIKQDSHRKYTVKMKIKEVIS
tara:strand:- start:4718 stop:6043 length:1326 start_codon:yes stop_codon:yes gene_type:complete